MQSRTRSHGKKGGSWARLRTFLRRRIDEAEHAASSRTLDLLALCPLACRAESCDNGVQANGETIELSGFFYSEVLWGPPNFGENPATDSQFVAWFISLSKPLVVQGGVEVGGDYFPSVSVIKLSSDTTSWISERLRPLFGKLVVVRGKLWRGIAEGDVTPISIAMKTIEPTDPNICRIIPGN